jgi:hypothetical protein
LIAWIGWIHLHLWIGGYREIPTLGPFFLVAGIAGFVLAAALLAWPSRLSGLAGIILSIGSFGALIISVNFGLFGFKEALSASYVSESIALELAATLTLCVWVALDFGAESRRPRTSLPRNARYRNRRKFHCHPSLEIAERGGHPRTHES